MAVQLHQESSSAPPPPPMPDAQLAAAAAAAAARAPDRWHRRALRPRSASRRSRGCRTCCRSSPSLVIHVALIVLAWLLVGRRRQGEPTPSLEEQVIVPDARSSKATSAASPTRASAAIPTRPPRPTSSPRTRSSDGWNKLPSEIAAGRGARRSGETRRTTDHRHRRRRSRSGSGKGVGVGSGDGDGAVRAVRRPRRRHAASGPSASWASSGNAQAVAYVCDASGSMMGLPFDLLKIELKKAIDMLEPIQAFNICLLPERRAPTPFSKAAWSSPTRTTSSKAYQFSTT